MTGSPVTIDRRDGIAVVIIDNPPVNALGLAVRRALSEAVSVLDRDPQVSAVVLTGAGRIFVGGADISEFDSPPEPPHLPDIVAMMEAAAKPWIAAINGPALGGGTELALGCRYRIVAENARFSLPEINLGIIPGAGGTQRLPRLIGVASAIDVVAANRQLTSVDAFELGLAGRLAKEDLIKAAIAFAREAASLRNTPASAREIPDPGPEFWAATQARIAKSARGNAAPLAALAALRHGAEAGFAAGIALERETFLKLRASREAAALRYLFFAERTASRPVALRGVEVRRLTRVGVVGGGTMGTGIAAALCNAGFPVVLSETDETGLARCLDRLKGIFEAQVKRGLHDENAAIERLERVTGTIGLDSMSGCDLVIEAVFEDLATKRAVFEQLTRICPADTILATNTSYLDPEQIIAGLAEPGRFIGLHFFSPAQVMKLLEIVSLASTAPSTLATGFELARRLGKVPVRAGNCEGFIGNRILKRYRAEAEAMVREGISLVAIDAAMRSFGFGMGPFEMQDMAGLDIAFRSREADRASGKDVPETLGDVLARAGRFGQKAGAGWYDYAPGSRTPLSSDAVAKLLESHCAAGQTVAQDDIARRLLAVMSAEGRQILAEGIADNAEAIDLVEVHGYGFPRHKGGPMFIQSAGKRQD